MNMKNSEMKKVLTLIKRKEKFLISAHVNPEGDSIGSQLAMYHMLKKLGKDCVMLDHDKVPDNLEFLPGAREITDTMPEGFSPDASIILDCPVIERTGKVADSLSSSAVVVNIDHHMSNEYYADINWVEDSASSVGEMLFHLAEELGMEKDTDIAKAIYAAIVTDTGSFSYNNTSPATHEITGKLVASGVDTNVMHSEIFEKKDFYEVKMLGKALSTLTLESEGKLAHICLTRHMYNEEGIAKVTTDSFINFPRSVKGVEVAIFFKESTGEEENVYVSFRSSGGVDVNALASRFDGGGHKKASGCMLSCEFEEARRRVLTEAKKVIKEAVDSGAVRGGDAVG